MNNKNPNNLDQITQGDHSSPSSVMPYQQPWLQDNKDEIDLFDLMNTIWEGKFKIAAFVLVFALIAAAYALTATKWYESEFKVKPVKQYQLAGINNSELVTMSPQDVLDELRGKLFSPEHFFDFYHMPGVQATFGKKPENLSEQQYAYQIFNKNIKLLEPKVSKKGQQAVDVYVGLGLTFPEGIEGSAFLLGYLAWTTEKIKQELLQTFDLEKADELKRNSKKLERILAEYTLGTKNEIQRLKESDEFKLKELYDSLVALKNKLLKENGKEIQILNENIAIAKKLGFKNPISPSNFKSNRKVEEEVFKAEFSSMDTQPLYYRGYESLLAEKEQLVKRTKNNYPSNQIVELERQIEMLKQNRDIEKLLSRTDPAPFLTEYTDLQKRNAYLNTLEIDVESASLYEMYVYPLPPAAPIKPKKLLIVALAILLGGFIGVIYVLLMGSVKARRKEHEEQVALNLGE